MDRNYDAPATRFALEILKNHPQISYEHAVSAAEYSGVARLPRRVFFAVAERLGLRRDEAAEIPQAESAPRGTPSLPASSQLLLRLDRFREQMTETATMRDALLRMQATVRAALQE